MLFGRLSVSQIRVQGDRVLVQRIKPAEKTIGGIVLPDSAQSKINKGTVIAVGPGRRNPTTGQVCEER
jgi:chaperonin GroES